KLDQLPGLKKDRALVLAGGLSIMLAAFYALDIQGPMVAGEGALRAGVLAQLRREYYANAASNACIPDVTSDESSASTMILNFGSVPEGRIRTRPRSPNVVWTS